MIKRIIEISKPAALRLKHKQLIIRQEEKEHSVPIEDIGILILDNPAITHTQQLFAECCANNIAVVLCDTKHLPAYLLLPLVGNSQQTKFLAEQISTPIPTKKRLWQLIVKEKVNAQARVLADLVSDSPRLKKLAMEVKSGDPQNIESQAARIYWEALFGNQFRRDRSQSGINVLLNYGYTVMRAAVARALVGTGLHPSLGIHHRSQYNSFALADDLLEPLRPLIDIKVFQLASEGKENELGIEQKQSLLECLSWQVSMDKDKSPLMVALHEYAAGVRRTLSREIKQPLIPKII